MVNEIQPAHQDQRYPRRFYLHRHEDPTGISGTGVVADGVVWQTGAVTIHWLGGGESYNTWPGPNAIAEIERIHGHGGKTTIVWRDDEDGYSDPESPVVPIPVCRWCYGYAPDPFRYDQHVVGCVFAPEQVREAAAVRLRAASRNVS